MPQIAATAATSDDNNERFVFYVCITITQLKALSQSPAKNQAQIQAQTQTQARTRSTQLGQAPCHT